MLTVKIHEGVKEIEIAKISEDTKLQTNWDKKEIILVSNPPILKEISEAHRHLLPGVFGDEDDLHS